MPEYTYSGPVVRSIYGREMVIDTHYKACTNAPTKAKAISNLTYRFCRANGLEVRKLSFPGKLEVAK